MQNAGNPLVVFITLAYKLLIYNFFFLYHLLHKMSLIFSFKLQLTPVNLYNKLDRLQYTSDNVDCTIQLTTLMHWKYSSIGDTPLITDMQLIIGRVNR